jgi:hypothetical protein
MNIFSVKTGNNQVSKQSENTRISSPPASPLAAGRAGLFQRQMPCPLICASVSTLSPARQRARANAHETYRDEGSSSAVPSTPSEITEENDDSEFEQLHQQRLAHELNSPLPPPNGSVAPRFQPTLSPIAENMPEEAESSQKLPPFKTQPPLKGVP